MAGLETGSGDFRDLAASGEQPGVTKAIGMAFASARDGLAGGLVAARVTPNALTGAGFLVTLGSAACLSLGAGDAFGPSSAPGQSCWPVWAGALLIAAGACDMLDGAVARIGRKSTSFGAVLDSSLDRFSDVAIFLALVGHFCRRGNLTYTVLAAVALANTFLISYVKARAEDLIEDCTVGWWQRGERHVALLIACFTCHVPMFLWQQATLPMLTVFRRLDYTRKALGAKERGLPSPAKGPPTGRMRLLHPWRYPRGSLPFDLVAAVNVAILVFGPWIFSFFRGRTDPLRRLIEAVSG
ncbi:MAG TPA: CDP-alcohol phosphatidyltransferase family protein [Phycisphaerae bacterium]|nr:CDP-alcohol phosphatidyltransferase family protein [Phycisphaerae bacterium]